jgi:glutaredoxin
MKRTIELLEAGPMFFARPFAPFALMALLALAGFRGNDANAQQIYRIVAPDGRVTFSDKPPREGSAKPTAAAAVRLPADSGTANLPFELRQVASRYPVTLYTAPGCAPCGAGRAMLASRGVPFTEKTVTTNEDIDALKRLAGSTASLPFLTIGGQQIRGFAQVEWVQFLDAAGYPKTSQLPASYSPSPATPLVAAQDPQRAPARAAAPAEPVAAPTPLPAAENPTGIRF